MCSSSVLWHYFDDAYWKLDPYGDDLAVYDEDIDDCLDEDEKQFEFADYIPPAPTRE
jgi:hypothetical protein